MMYWLIGIITFCCLVFYFYFGNRAMYLFYTCMKLDVRISYFELAMMKYRGVPVNDLLTNAIKLKEKGIDVKMKDLELHLKSGGRLPNVVNILLNAKKSKIDLTYHQAAMMDLAEITKQKKASEKAKTNEQQNESVNTDEQSNDLPDSENASVESPNDSEKEPVESSNDSEKVKDFFNKRANKDVD